VAYIENVLKGETKTMEFVTKKTVQVEIMTETETTTSKETERSTAERFEVANESNSAIKETEDTKAGVTMSASYGPFVSVSANASEANSRSKDESTKTATRFSKEVTTKATDKIQQRVLQRTTTKTTTETTQTAGHTFDNSKGTAHISGVYQWQNKVHEAQTWNYGQRTMLGFMLPEPGAFLFDKIANP
jgi:hypothetical protein